MTPSPCSFADLCESLGKEPLQVRNLQRALGLKTDPKAVYAEPYVRFLWKIVALRTMGVPQETITELFQLETKLLKLLHVDSLGGSDAWFLCDTDSMTSGGLLLTGHALGFSVGDPGIQQNLDFGAKDPELFRGHEMGEDVRRILGQYVQLRAAVVARVQRGMPRVRNSLLLAEQMVGRRTTATKPGKA